MSQSLICPFWVSENRNRRDGIGPVYQKDIQLTEIRVTNPSNSEGIVEFIFYEARGDGNYYRSDWASGRWVVSPKWQRYIRPDPSSVYGPRFYTYGWFEVWLSRDDMTIDVAIQKIARNVANSSISDSALSVEGLSNRTINVIPKRVPLFVRIVEGLGFPMPSPLPFPSGTRPFDDFDLPDPPMTDPPDQD
jgi:hypothetical protein